LRFWNFALFTTIDVRFCHFCAAPNIRYLELKFCMYTTLSTSRFTLRFLKLQYAVFEFFKKRAACSLVYICGFHCNKILYYRVEWGVLKNATFCVVWHTFTALKFGIVCFVEWTFLFEGILEGLLGNFLYEAYLIEFSLRGFID
jgi:hypothetical protein